MLYQIGTMSLVDEAGLSNQKKRPCIKHESIDNNLDTNLNNVQLNEENEFILPNNDEDTDLLNVYNESTDEEAKEQFKRILIGKGLMTVE